jgi:hypothetical protein
MGVWHRKSWFRALVPSRARCLPRLLRSCFLGRWHVVRPIRVATSTCLPCDRPTGVPWDSDPWTEALQTWRCEARVVAGRPVEILEADESEVPGLLAQPSPSVWWAAAAEGVLLSGRPLTDLV